MPSNLLTIHDWIQHGAGLFEQNGLYYGHGTDNPLDEAAILVTWVLGIGWDQLEDNLAREVSQEQQKSISALFGRRVEQKVPAAYITGEAWFAGHKFKVNEHVLVPRSPIAELIHNEFRPWLHKSPRRILDLCCGSACIGLACAHAFPDVQLTVSDISEEALKVAKDNIDEHGLSGRVKIIQSDCFANISEQFDLIVTNPPYVDAEDWANMPAEYHAEPRLGLYSGEDGLDLTREILKGALNYLSSDGVLFVEVGNSAETLENLLPQVPFTWVEFEHGGHGVFVLSRAELLAYRQHLSSF